MKKRVKKKRMIIFIIVLLFISLGTLFVLIRKDPDIIDMIKPSKESIYDIDEKKEGISDDGSFELDIPDDSIETNDGYDSVSNKDPVHNNEDHRADDLQDNEDDNVFVGSEPGELPGIDLD